MKYLLTFTARTPLTTLRWAGIAPAAAYTGWMYQVLSAHNPELSDHIHHPSAAEKTAIRPFAISPLTWDLGHATRQGYVPETPFAALTVGTFDPAITEAIEAQARQVPLVIPTTSSDPMVFTLLQLDAYGSPDWTESTYTWHSHPMQLRDFRRTGHPGFLRPTDPEWIPALQQNLAHKVRQFHGLTLEPEQITLTPQGPWQTRYQRPYGHPVPAFRVPKGLRMTAPAAVHDVVWTLGFGVNHSSGFGTLSLDSTAQDALQVLESFPHQS